jgi:segregation and condensation protein B
VSRKRSKKAEVQAPVEAIVEEEILAEGSGPVALEAASSQDGVVSDEELAEAAGLVSDEELAEAAGLVSDEELAAGGTVSDEELAEAALQAGGLDGEHLEASDAIEGSETLEASDTIEGTEGTVEGAATLPTAAAAMEPAELKKLVEALVFASDKPVTVLRLRQLTRVADTKRLESTLVELQSDYAERGLILTSVSGGWQFRTRPQFSAWVQQLIAGRPVRLTRAQLETLAIIAYRQPITRPEIDDIRGVDSSATLKLLLDRTLIRVLGKKEEVGRPMLYGTTKEFLDFFSLGDLRELPTLREYSELSDESRRVMTDRLGIDPNESFNAAPAATDVTDTIEGIEPAEADASTLSDLAEKYLREEREADISDVADIAIGSASFAAVTEDGLPVDVSSDALNEAMIDVDAMPGILADADSIADDSDLRAESLITDEIVDATRDADDAPETYDANEPE